MDAIAQNAAEAIFSSLILGLAIAIVAWALMRLLPPGRAALRFAVWFTALVGIGLVPLLQVGFRFRSAGAQFTQAGFIVLPSHWAACVLSGWALVAFVGLTRVVAGMWHLHRVRSASTAVSSAELSSGAREIVVRAAQARAFELRASDQVRVPIAIGFWRPAVVLPSYLLNELSSVQLSQVLLHETTHLLRYDDWTNLLQKIARAVMFFHPAVWWLESRLTLEREIACDEAVVAETLDPRAYAECLALLAEKTLLRRTLALVQTAVSRLSHTSLRVKRLIEPGHKQSVRAWSAGAAVVGILACSAMLVQAPNLVSFQGNTSTVAGKTSVATSVQDVALRTDSLRPQILPAAFKLDEKPVRSSTHGINARAQRAAAHQSFAARSRPPVDEKLQVTLASHEEERAVPVVVTTTMIVQSSGATGVSEQVWRMWQVTVYYPTAEKNAFATSNKT